MRGWLQWPVCYILESQRGLFSFFNQHIFIEHLLGTLGHHPNHWEKMVNETICRAYEERKIQQISMPHYTTLWYIKCCDKTMQEATKRKMKIGMEGRGLLCIGWSGKASLKVWPQGQRSLICTHGGKAFPEVSKAQRGQTVWGVGKEVYTGSVGCLEHKLRTRTGWKGGQS